MTSWKQQWGSWCLCWCLYSLIYRLQILSPQEMHYLLCGHCAHPLQLMLADGFPLVELERTASYKLSGPNGLVPNITDRSRSPAVYSIVFSIHFCPDYRHLPLITTTLHQASWCQPTFLIPLQRARANLYTFHATKYQGEAVEAERWWSAIVNPLCNWAQHASFPPP